MTGVYFDQKAKHWRVRISVEGKKQMNVGTTKDKWVACAMYDLFVHLNKLQDSHQLNNPRMTVIELSEHIEERDPKALKNLINKSRYILIRNEKLKKQEV